MTMSSFILDDAVEITKRQHAVVKFFNEFFRPEDTPFFLSDSACIYDFYFDEESLLIQKIMEKYGVILTPEDFKAPFWKVLDKFT